MPIEIPNIPEKDASRIVELASNPINKSNIAVGSALSPQSVNRNRELSTLTGTPTQVYDQDDSFASQEWTGMKDEANKQIAPFTYDMMNKTPEDYAALKEDADELSIGEHLLRGAGSLIGGAVTSIGMVPSGLGRLFSIAHDSTLNAFLAPFESLNPELAADIKEAVTSPIPYSPWWTNPETSLESLGESIKDTGEEFSPEDPSFIEEVIGGVGQMASQMAVMLATGGLGGGTMLFAQGADITGDKLDETREEGKDAESWEGLATVLGASVSAVSEKYGLDILMRRLPANVRNRFVRVLAGGGSEATQEVLEEVGQNLVIMGFDKTRAPATTAEGLLHQGAVGFNVGAIAAAIIPGRKRTAQVKALMDAANDKAANAGIREQSPKEAVKQSVEAIKGAGITGARIKIKDLVAYVKGDSTKTAEVLAPIKEKITKAAREGRKDVILTSTEFGTYIFGTDHYNGLGDHFEFFLKADVNRTGLTPNEAINQIVENANKITARAEKIEEPTLRQRTQKFIKKFTKGEDIDLNEILLKAPSDVIVRVEQILNDIRKEEVVGEKEIRRNRLTRIKDERELLEEQIPDLELDIQIRRDEGKPTKRLEARLEKLQRKEREFRAEETLLDRVLPVQEKVVPRVRDPAKVTTRAGRLRELNVKSSKETEVEARKAFRKAKKGAREDIGSAQRIAATFIENSGLSRDNKGKYLLKLKNFDSLEKLEAGLPALQQSVIEDLTRQRKSQVKGALKKIIKKGEKAKTSPAVNALILEAKGIMKLTVGAAKERLEAGAEVSDPIINSLLALKAGSENVDIAKIEKILLDLDAVVEGGRAIGVASELYRVAQRETLRERVKQVIGETPKESLSKTRERVQEGVAFLFLGPSGSWRNKLQHIFSSKDKKVVDQLLNDLSLFTESREHVASERRTVQQFEKLVQDRTKMTQKQITKQWNEDNSKRVFIGQFTMADGRVQKLTRTKAEMRMIWMQSQNPDIKESFSSHTNEGGFTPAVFEAIEAQFTSFDKQMIESQLEFYSDYYDRINLAYRKNYGLNLPKVDNYVPVRRDFGDGTAGEEFLRSILYRGGPKPASLKARKSGVKVRVKRASDITTLQSHMAEMEYFIAFGEKVNTLNAVFSGNQNELMNLISDKYGRKVANIIQEDLRWFSHKGAMTGTAIDEALTQLMRNFSFAQLGAKPQIGLKQLASFAAFAQDVNSIQFTKHLLHLATPAGWKEARELMNESSFFVERGMNFDNDFKDLARDSNNNNLLNFMGTHPSFTKVMMLPIRYGDKGAILIGGYAHVKAAMDAGASKVEALEQFARLANATQQSSDPDQLSSLQRTSALGRIWAQFLSSANAVARAEYEAISEFSKGRLSKQEFAKRMIIFHLVIPNLIMFIGNGASWDNEDQLQASILGALTGLLLVGDVLEFTAKLVTGSDRPFDIEGRHPFQFMQSFMDAIQGDWDIGFDDLIEGSKTIENLLEFGGALTGIPMETLYNMLRGTAKVTEAALESKGKDLKEGVGLMLGYSPYTLEK